MVCTIIKYRGRVVVNGMVVGGWHAARAASLERERDRERDGWELEPRSGMCRCWMDANISSGGAPQGSYWIPGF